MFSLDFSQGLLGIHHRQTHVAGVASDNVIFLLTALESAGDLEVGFRHAIILGKELIRKREWLLQGRGEQARRSSRSRLNLWWLVLEKLLWMGR